MRPAVAFAATWLLSLTALAGEPGPTLALGQPAPKADAKLGGVDGKAVSLKDVAGKKGTLVVFTCNHCPYAKAWEGRIAAIGNEWKGKGFGVVAINANDPAVKAEDGLDGMKERAQKLGLQFPYVVDDKGVAEAFGARKTPEVFLFDAAGKLAYHGAVDDNSEDAAAVKQHYLKDALAAVAAGKAPAQAETKAMGCGIKFRK